MEQDRLGRVAKRAHAPILAGCLAFVAAFWIIERAARYCYLSIRLTNLCYALGVLHYDREIVQLTILVAWSELLIFLLLAFLIGRIVNLALSVNALPFQVRLGLLGLGFLAIVLAALPTAQQDYVRCSSGFYLLLVLVPWVAYSYRAVRRLPTWSRRVPFREWRRRLSDHPFRLGAASAVVICTLCYWVSYQMEWSRQRTAALERGDLDTSHFTQMPDAPPLSLRLFGERDAPDLLVPPDRGDQHVIDRLRSLFPETLVLGRHGWAEWRPLTTESPAPD